MGPGLERLDRPVVAIGNFDGVHRGHRAVIATAMERARAARRPAAVLTFEPHPRSFFRPDEPSFHLTSEAAKLRLLAATGLDGAIVLTFDAALASLSAEAFVESILVDRLAVTGAVIGFNFHFGKERRGSPDFLIAQGAHHGFSVDVVPPFHAGRPAGVVRRGARRARRGPRRRGQRTARLSVVRHRPGGARRQARPHARLSDREPPARRRTAG